MFSPILTYETHILGQDSYNKHSSPAIQSALHHSLYPQKPFQATLTLGVLSAYYSHITRLLPAYRVHIPREIAPARGYFLLIIRLFPTYYLHII